MAFNDYTRYFSQGEQKYGLRPGTGSALMSLEDASGNPNARSPKGASGVLQLMPGTASDMGVSNPSDPATNIDGGLHYFSNILHNQAHGDYRTAAMGYNAGPNRSSFPQSSQSYADQFMGRLQPSQPAPDPYYSPQSGGQPQMPPQGNPYQRGMPTPMAPVTSLGGMAQPMQNTPQPGGDAGPNLQAFAQSQMQGGIPTKQPSKFNVGNILGTLGDAMSAYGGKQPTFGPFLREQQMMDKQQNFEMQKFNQELQMRMLAMMNPPDIMESKVFQSLPPQQQRAFLQYKDAVSPQYTMTAQGQVLNHRVTTPPAPAVAELRQAVANGDHAAVQEFDQTFGPGASAEALGAQ